MKKNIKWIAVTTVAAVAMVAVGSLQAQESAPTPAPSRAPSVVVGQPAQAVEAQVVEAQAVPVAEIASAACCAPKYCISYRKHHAFRRVCCDSCVQPYTAMLSITDPCTRCPVEVPVCVPGCCTDAPKVSCRRGLFGRTITEFMWCCGFRAKIVLTRRNDITVHTYGS